MTMRRTGLLIGTMVAALLAAVTCGWAGPPVSSTWAIPGSYDITANYLGNNTYQWNLTYHGAGVPGPEYMRAFAVYGTGANYVPGTAEGPEGWKVGGPIEGNEIAAFWMAAPATWRLPVGSTVTYQVQFDAPFTQTGSAIHVQYPEGSLWANNTPQLPTVALMLGGLPLALGYVRWRRRERETG